LAGPTAPSHIWNVARTTTSADTTPGADAVRFERYSRKSPAEKAARVADLTRAEIVGRAYGWRAPDGS